jgi:hypothetical protein
MEAKEAKKGLIYIFSVMFASSVASVPSVASVSNV